MRVEYPWAFLVSDELFNVTDKVPDNVWIQRSINIASLTLLTIMDSLLDRYNFNVMLSPHKIQICVLK